MGKVKLKLKFKFKYNATRWSVEIVQLMLEIIPV